VPAALVATGIACDVVDEEKFGDLTPAPGGGPLAVDRKFRAL
jgi:hypothetical protein